MMNKQNHGFGNYVETKFVVQLLNLPAIYLHPQYPPQQEVHRCQTLLPPSWPGFCTSHIWANLAPFWLRTAYNGLAELDPAISDPFPFSALNSLFLEELETCLRLTALSLLHFLPFPSLFLDLPSFSFFHQGLPTHASTQKSRIIQHRMQVTVLSLQRLRGVCVPRMSFCKERGIEAMGPEP
eukprot:gb/GEZN01017177.1/.p1 GENE.gb/GEZN01017177.1/~~gb/GEZN01017177.1/.p1  ORF type:complete len:182 (-),score=5.67 gb/GEZN01017177.1/:5-550(-)